MNKKDLASKIKRLRLKKGDVLLVQYTKGEVSMSAIDSLRKSLCNLSLDKTLGKIPLFIMSDDFRVTAIQIDAMKANLDKFLEEIK